jgi:O-antigen/teichoic acid export membrane protein
LLPLLAKSLAEKKTQEFKKLMSRSIDLMMILICPIIAGALAIGPELMATISGKEFREAGNILQILILAVGVIYINTIFSHAIVALNAQKHMLPIYAFVAALTLGGYLLFIPAYGMYAAAWLTVLSEIIIGIGNIFVTTRSSEIDINWKPSFAAIIAAATMGITVFIIRDFWLPIPLLTGAFIYIALIFLLGGIKIQELKQIIATK